MLKRWGLCLLLLNCSIVLGDAVHHFAHLGEGADAEGDVVDGVGFLVVTLTNLRKRDLMMFVRGLRHEHDVRTRIAE